MNKVILVARATKDPEVRNGGAENSAIANLSVACERKYKREGQPTADFINCKAFGKQAEFIEKYIKKGTKVVIEGRIQTGSYTNKDGAKVYTTDVMIESIEFAESKNASSNNNEQTSNGPAKSSGADFMQIPDVDGDDFPFN